MPAGFYNPTAGNGVYYSCPAGVPSVLTTACGNVCALGTYSSSGTDYPSACSPCPAGSYCPSAGCTVCAACGYAYFAGAANCNYGAWKLSPPPSPSGSGVLRLQYFLSLHSSPLLLLLSFRHSHDHCWVGNDCWIC